MSQNIKIKAFGMVAEKIGSSELAMSNPGNVEELKLQLFEQFPELKSVKFGFSVNKKMVSDNAEIPVGAEIALLPPFSGG
jgi:sulfur-carrier protein